MQAVLEGEMDAEYEQIVPLSAQREASFLTEEPIAKTMSSYVGQQNHHQAERLFFDFSYPFKLKSKRLIMKPNSQERRCKHLSLPRDLILCYSYIDRNVYLLSMAACTKWSESK